MTDFFRYSLAHQTHPIDRGTMRQKRTESSQPINRRGTLYNGSTYGSVNLGALTKGKIDLGRRGGLGVANAIAPTSNEGFSYTTTDASITWYYDGTNSSSLPKVRLSDKTYIGLAPGSITVTGLTAATDYYFFPFYAVNNPCKAVSWVVSSSASGSPSIAFALGSVEATQLQNLQDRIPLSSGGIKGSTAAGGMTGSGSGGGSDGGHMHSGGCPRVGQVVKERERGVILIEDVRPGDWIDSPSGWVLVIRAVLEQESQWVLMTTEEGEELEISVSTPQPMADGSVKPSPQLKQGDEILMRPGYSGFLRQSEKNIFDPDYKVVITVDHDDHWYYAGWMLPNIATPNAVSKASTL